MAVLQNDEAIAGGGGCKKELTGRAVITLMYIHSILGEATGVQE
jgi:hypothetical protein